MGKLNDQRRLNRDLLELLNRIALKEIGCKSISTLVRESEEGKLLHTKLQKLQIEHKKALDDLKNSVIIDKKLRPYFWQTWGRKLRHLFFELEIASVHDGLNAFLGILSIYSITVLVIFNLIIYFELI